MKVKRKYEICQRCNYDRHVCGGCGSQLSHLEEKTGRHFRVHHPEEWARWQRPPASKKEET